MSERSDLCTLPPTGSLLAVLEALERSHLQIVLVLDPSGRLIGTITDGDVRRALLKGASLESEIGPHMQREFTTVGAGVGRAEALDLMRARDVQAIPIVDAEGRVAGLHLLREIIGLRQRPNWAVVMAGGRGARLHPLTERTPKPMLTVAGRPILERIVLHLVGAGIRRIFLAIHYMGSTIEAHFADGADFGCRIDYLREDAPLGSGGALSLLPAGSADPLLVMNGDLITQADLGAMLEQHVNGGFQATVGVTEYRHQIPFGCVELESARIVRFEEKPLLARWINAGLYVLQPRVVARVPARTEFPLTALIEGCLERREPVGAFVIEDEWIDVGFRDQLRLAREGA